jgi:hypothetical protein
MNTVVQWKIYTHLGENKISIALWSDTKDLSDVLIGIDCTFQYLMISILPQSKGY